MDNSELSRIILKETLLMKEHVRNNPDKIAELLNDNFIEFTSSGKQYNYSFGDTFGASNSTIEMEDESVRTIVLNDETILLLYVAIKKNLDGSCNRSRRSSVWNKINGKWKLVFHQGTNIDG